jgi:hypothetical protein
MLGHPVAMEVYGAGYATGAAFLAHEMRRSRFGVVCKLWWLPQVYSMEQNVYGCAGTRGYYRR